MDATKEYKAVKHHRDTAIESMLSMYKIGAVKKLNFGDSWGVAVIDKKIEYISLGQLYLNWLNCLYLVVEMENTQIKEIDFYQKHVFHDVQLTDNWRLRVQSIAKFLNDFLSFYLEVMIGEKFQLLWRATVGLCAPTENFFYMEKISHAIKTTEYKNDASNFSGWI